MCGLVVSEAQGSLPPRPHALYVGRTRTSLGRAVRVPRTVAPQVLATETKAERALWIEALQPSPSQATTADGAARGADGAWLSETAAVREGEAAALETPAALAEVEAKRGEAQEALSTEDAALGAARSSLQSAVRASERADAQLRHARARLKVH